MQTLAGMSTATKFLQLLIKLESSLVEDEGGCC